MGCAGIWLNRAKSRCRCPRPAPRKLSGVFEDYVHYCRQSRHTTARQSNSIRRVLSALCDYLQQERDRHKPASHRGAGCLYGRVLSALSADAPAAIIALSCAAFCATCISSRHLKKRPGAAFNRRRPVCQGQAAQIFATP